jgi:hypothetical protein
MRGVLLNRLKPCLPACTATLSCFSCLPVTALPAAIRKDLDLDVSFKIDPKVQAT